MQRNDLSKALLQLSLNPRKQNPNKSSTLGSHGPQRDTLVGQNDIKRDAEAVVEPRAEAEGGCRHEGLRRGVERVGR